MPRELIHWSVLSCARESEKLAPFPAVVSCLERYPHAAALGAITHDAPYFYRLGNHEFEQVAAKLHGRFRNDTFEPLREFAKGIIANGGENETMLWSFLLGMVSHYAVDTSFHPLVTYMTGDYHDPDSARRVLAQTRHRAYEVYLDLWGRETQSLEYAGRLSRLFKEVGDDLDPVCALLEERISLDSGDPHWRSAYAWMNRLQGFFLSPFVGFAMKSASLVLPGRFDAMFATFSYSRSRVPESMKGEIYYKNPMSGEEYQETLQDIFDRAVLTCTDLFSRFEALISGASKDPVEILGDIKGVSLDLGISGVNSNDATYFNSDEGIFAEIR